MSKVLKLYNTYSRCIKEARLARGVSIASPGVNGTSLTHGSLYICGPTVYSDSHLGHALTYVRADLLRRALKALFNVRLITVMNITDVDDKILDRSKDELPTEVHPDTRPDNHPFRLISEKFYNSFVNDMNYIRVAPPDLTVKVSKQVNTIINYIRTLERSGHAYLAPNGDIYFRVSSVPNYRGRVDCRKDDQNSHDNVKCDPRDFALWKAAKPGEPVWIYKSDVTGNEVPGRPGWHVQCSAIASAVFGNQLDFHFSGKDLIFPHNYNEQACCCAYHNLNTSRDINVWSANWLHSGHLVLREEKMSKSLGNVVGIRKFINDSSVNALRLLCIDSHYRADVDFNEELLNKMRTLDHKISAFTSYISDAIRQTLDGQTEHDIEGHTIESEKTVNLEEHVNRVHEDITDGVCEDLDFSKGLYSMLELSKLVYKIGPASIRPRDLVIIRHLLSDWCSMCGLHYGTTSGKHNEDLINLVRDFRQEIRDSVIQELKRRKKSKTSSDDNDDFLNSLLGSCDIVRSRLDNFGFVIRDKKSPH